MEETLFFHDDCLNPLIELEEYITIVAGTGRAVRIRHGSATVTGTSPEVRHCAAHHVIKAVSHEYNMTT